jgi:hypothetical protein
LQAYQEFGAGSDGKGLQRQAVALTVDAVAQIWRLCGFSAWLLGKFLRVQCDCSTQDDGHD